MMSPDPTDETLRALIEGALGEAERVELEKLLERNPDRLRRFETITGYDDFRQLFLRSAPRRRPVRSDLLVDLIGKLKAGDFSRPTVEDEAISVLDVIPSGDQPGRLGDFEVLDVIACGGMGIVFRARDPQLERWVAIKALAPRFAKDSDARERFLSEARLIAALDHPNILPIYTVAEGEQVPYFVMPLIEGENLADLVAREGPLGKKRALRIALQAGRALVAAHAAGVIHRDVKPANLLIGKDSDRVWVADFGIAQKVASGVAEVAGTPAFAAPEQLEGAAPSVRSDLYGLGATLYFAMFGQVPELGRGGVSIPQGLLPLLHPEPEARPDSAEAVVRLMQRQLRSRLPRWMVIGVGVMVAVLVLFFSMSPLGLKGSINRVVGGWKGEAFFIEGKLGTYASLPNAVGNATDGSVVLVDFDGERALASTVIERALTLRAAPGRRPVFVPSAVRTEMLKIKAPTELVGLSFVRPPVSGRPLPLISAMFCKLTLRDCTIIALQEQHLAINAPIFSYGVPEVVIEDSRILTGNIRWYNMSGELPRGGTNTERGSLRVSNSFIFAARGPNMDCENLEVDVEFKNVTYAGADLFMLRMEGGKFHFDVRDSILLPQRSVVWFYSGEDGAVINDSDAAGAVFDWKGGGNWYPGEQSAFLLYSNEQVAGVDELRWIKESSPQRHSLSSAWFVADTLAGVRAELANWLEESRSSLNACSGSGADLSVMEDWLEDQQAPAF